MSTRPKLARSWLAAAAGVAMVAGLAPMNRGASAAGRAPATVLQADASRVRFVVEVPQPTFTPSTQLAGFERIAIPGFDPVGEPGTPLVLARRYFVALPPTGGFALNARVVTSQALGAHRLQPSPTPIAIGGDEEFGPVTGERVDYDEAAYRSWMPPGVAEHDEPAYIRRQRVLPITVHPLFYDATTSELSVATRVEIEVTFQGGAPSRVAPEIATDAGQWTEVFGRLFVNPRQARLWRTPKPARAPAAYGARGTASGAVKLRVRETGVHKVSAVTLLAEGFPAGVAVTDLRLYRRGYDDTALDSVQTEVPVYVREGVGGTTGVFDANDLVVFYGLRLRDDATQGDTREQYSDHNVYWLEPGTGTPMATRTPAPGFITADTTTAFFPASAHIETDGFFRDGSPATAGDVYYFTTGRATGPVDMTFPMGTVRTGGSLTITAELHGWAYNNPPARTVSLSLVNSKGELVLDPAYVVNNKDKRTFVSAPIPAASVDIGSNVFRMARPAGATRTRVDALINFLKLSYGSPYRARGNTLRFNTATLAGDTSITVTGLSSSADFELFDLTTPTAPVRCEISPAHFTPVAGGFAFSYRENVPARLEFVLLPVSRMIDIGATDVTLDVPSAIIGGPEENGVDVLVVSHASYLAQMQSWASYRRGQGYRVLLVDVEDLYDEFNGGVPHARAVYRFARHMFETGDASWLVLVGDASEDSKRVFPDSGPNFVPTFTRIDKPQGLALDEVVTTDKRLVKFPGPGGTVDEYPDMIVGRLPVGNATELDIVLAKTLQYESPDASEFWRKRMIIVADDQYSEGSAEFAVVNQYCCQPGEDGFESGQEQVALTIENSLPAGYDVIRFYLRDYTSQFYPDLPCTDPDNCAIATAAWAFTRQGATEQLLAEMERGATLLTIQAHMNRATVTHERLLSTESGSLLGGTGRDHLRVNNRGRPWIVFGMGCHFSDYAVWREQSDLWMSNAPNGDAFGEQLLLQNDRGAVGTYGSTGFEFLGANSNYMNTMARIWFYEAPYDDMVNQTQAEWKFGELMFLVESQVLAVYGQRDPVERYHILGDPLLRIDAGPPAFDVTVNGRAVSSGEFVHADAEGDSIRVVAVVTDENAIHDFELEIDGVPDSLAVEQISDSLLEHGRQYRVSFVHQLRADNYDLVLRALQSPYVVESDTLYHISAEFVLHVESRMEVSVNGRMVPSDGRWVPSQGDYRVDLSFPVFIPGPEIAVFMDGAPVSPFTLNNPSPEDSLAWIIGFQKTLSAGTHTLRVTAGTTITLDQLLEVSDETGLRDVVNYPNPFRDAGTHFMFTNDVEITDGTIDVYTTSGKRVRRLEIPPSARLPGDNAVFWDGRSGSGGALANGTYLYVIKVQQRGGSGLARGKVSKIN